MHRRNLTYRVTYISRETNLTESQLVGGATSKVHAEKIASSRPDVAMIVDIKRVR